MLATRLAPLAAALLLAGCSADYTIVLRNDSAATLVPYPVVTDPPPPHREADPSGSLGPGAVGAIDPTGFNPLYYAGGRKLSVTLQFALDDDPAQILARILSHSVPPGADGGDPALAPQLVDELLFEPIGTDLTFVLGAGDGFPLALEENP